MRDPAGGLAPSGTRFGAVVTAAGEGGFNGPGQPENQWWPWEATGRAAAPGLAGDVWRHPEAALDRAASAGCEVLVLPVEWARVEPSPGQVDRHALYRYARTAARCAERGIAPMVTLHDLAHPAWLGAEFWLMPGSPDRFAEHVARVARALGSTCRHWVTLDQPNLGALAGWVGGHTPPGRVGAVSDAWSVLDNLCAAHVLAYDAIHAHQPDAAVTMGLVVPGSYDWHRLPVDLMVAPALGVGRHDVDAWVDERRRHHDRQLPPASLRELGARRLASASAPYGRRRPGAAGWFRERRAAASPRRLLDVLYARTGPVPLDGLTMVWSPLSGTRSARPDALAQFGRMAGISPGDASHPTAPWDAPVDVEGMRAWCRALGTDPVALPLWVHGGLAMPPGRGARADGWDRPAYLRAMVAAAVELAEGGTPVSAFCYRDLGGAVDRAATGADTGLFAVTPRPDGEAVEWHHLDGTGETSGDALRRIVAAVRTGNRAVLWDAQAVRGLPPEKGAAPLEQASPQVPTPAERLASE